MNDRWNTHITGQLDRRTLLHKRYLIMRTIGQGGMGAVYQAKDLKRQGAICAIKEMSLSMVPPAEQAQAIQNFKFEAKILWGLNHPNLPSFTGFFAENHRYFLVMEYVDGNTLEELLERNGAPFSERRVLGWARQLCDVLNYLHSLNPPIIFRDMKPGNIMLTRNQQIKLIDFGIARFFRPTAGGQDTQLLGTPGYAPPEQYGRAQTDSRSDVYSLGMTLYHLLTDTLPENGFGANDTRALNPHISPTVARALEKSTAWNPEDRYENVTTFQRALFGEGNIAFDNGDQATTVEELADLCLRYPEEASDRLGAGEFEVWLHDVGEEDLSRTARRIRTQVSDPQESIELFLQVVTSRYPRVRAHTANGSHSPIAPPITRNSHPWFARKAVSPVQVSPRTLDFGPVYPGISEALVVSIAGNQGMVVSGTIRATEPWIVIDQTGFDSAITSVNVRINSRRLRSATHYTGTIVITPAENNARDIVVTVEADVVGYAANWPHRGKTIGADLDAYDEDYDGDDELTLGTETVVPQTSQTAAAQPTLKEHVEMDLAPSHKNFLPDPPDEDVAYQATRQESSKWNPWPPPLKPNSWQKRGLTFAAAFMASSLSYTLLARLSPLPPNPWFTVVLIGIVPTATIGALLVNWDRSWLTRDIINRAITGMGSSFLSLALIKLTWQLALHAAIGPLQLIVMQLIASIAAVFGTNATISDYVLFGASWGIAYMRWLIRIGTVAIGAILGYALTATLILSWFTLVGILSGIGIAAALIWRVEFLMKQHQMQQHQMQQRQR